MNAIKVTPGIPGKVIKEPPVAPTFDITLTLEEAIHLKLLLGGTGSDMNWGTYSGLSEALRSLGIHARTGALFNDETLVATAVSAAQTYIKESLNG